MQMIRTLFLASLASTFLLGTNALAEDQTGTLAEPQPDATTEDWPSFLGPRADIARAQGFGRSMGAL